MEVKYHLLNADGSYMRIFSDEPSGATDEQYAEFLQCEKKKEAEARALVAAGKTVVGFVARADTSSLCNVSAEQAEAMLRNSNIRIALKS
ncbi:Uncharacterised protein [Burkholderia pseudomallei]|nr:Uncharacterised protein [Burkholderia pseudomallei]